MKKPLAIALALAVALPLAACTPANDPAEQKPGTEQGTAGDAPTINVFSMRVSPDPNSEVVQKLNEKLGVKFVVNSVSDGDYNTKLNLFVASNSMPDVYGASPVGTLDAVRAAATLDEALIQKNMPEIYESFLKRVEKTGTEKEKILERWTVNGELKAFHNGNGQVAPYGILIRTDMLKELGAEMPKTIADWDALLAKYKAKYPEKYPLTCMNGEAVQSFYMFLAPYHVRRDDWILKDGTLQFSPFMPEMRDALVQLNQWYEKDYINPEYFSMYSKPDTHKAEFASGNTFFYQYYATTFPVTGEIDPASVAGMCLSNFPEATFDWCPFPTLGDGSKADVAVGDLFSGYLTCFGGHLAKEPEKLDTVMQTWNKLFSDRELLMLMRYGIEGTHYDLKDGAPVVRPEYSTYDAKSKAGFGWPFNGSFDIVDEIATTLNAPFVAEQRKTLLEGDGMYSRNTVNYGDSPRINGSMLNAAGEDLNAKNTSWQTQWDTMFTSVIVGQKSIEDFDKFIADWKAAVGDEMTQVANEQYLQQWLK